MAVIIGSARIDERGKISGGKAGDQTKNEVSTQNWYKHNKGWRVLRPKNAEKAQKIAKAMRAACDNNNIGYDQYQRNSLYSLVKPYGFDPAKANKPTETDCSALVRVCCNYAGIEVGDFTTGNEASKLLATGEFTELTSSKYTNQSDYLGAGDVLVTKRKGHTVVVLTNGPKYEGSVEEPEYALGDRILKKGMTGNDVKELQENLLILKYDVGSYGVDGDFGSGTENAVKAFQKDNGLLVDGEYGPDSHNKMMSLIKEEPEEPDEPDTEIKNPVKITKGSWNVRTGPSTSYSSVMVAHGGDIFEKVITEGWTPILHDGEVRWVSNKAVD